VFADADITNLQFLSQNVGGDWINSINSWQSKRVVPPLAKLS
jgi:hypothetical protein